MKYIYAYSDFAPPILQLVISDVIDNDWASLGQLESGWRKHWNRLVEGGDPNCSVAFLGVTWPTWPWHFWTRQGTHLDSDDAVDSTTSTETLPNNIKSRRLIMVRRSRQSMTYPRRRGSLLHLRIFQHTPATYARHPSYNSLCFGIHFMSGVNGDAWDMSAGSMFSGSRRSQCQHPQLTTLNTSGTRTSEKRHSGKN